MAGLTQHVLALLAEVLSAFPLSPEAYESLPEESAARRRSDAHRLHVLLGAALLAGCCCPPLLCWALARSAHAPAGDTPTAVLRTAGIVLALWQAFAALVLLAVAALFVANSLVL